MKLLTLVLLVNVFEQCVRVDSLSYQKKKENDIAWFRRRVLPGFNCDLCFQSIYLQTCSNCVFGYSSKIFCISGVFGFSLVQGYNYTLSECNRSCKIAETHTVKNT